MGAVTEPEFGVQTHAKWSWGLGVERGHVRSGWGPGPGRARGGVSGGHGPRAARPRLLLGEEGTRQRLPL